MPDDNIQCIECGALNSRFSSTCFACGDQLDEERRYRAQAGAPQPAAAPVPASRPPLVGPPPRAWPVANSASASAEDPTLLPLTPLEIVPDPLIGPIYRRTVRYYLSREVVKVKRGLVAKHTEKVEVYRIGLADGDIDTDQSVIQRLKGTGNIHITTNDPSCPQLTLRDVHDHERLADLLRSSGKVGQQERVPFNTGGHAFGG